ncbi:MAG: hypothetical protein ACM3VT_16665, partial [Solirubrobacterales bacterium]
MKNSKRILVLLAAVLLWTGSASAQLTLVENGQSAFKIVRADDASARTLLAAQELHDFLKQVTSAEFPIVSDMTPMEDCEIIVGDNAHLRQLPVTVDFAKVGPQGFTIRTVGR